MIELLAVLALPAAPPSAPPVLVVAPPAPLVLEAGGRTEVRLHVTVKDGFHVQANPASEPYLVPLRLDLGPPRGLQVGRPVYPEGTPHRLRGASRALSVYGGSFDVRVDVAAGPTQPAGEVRLSGALHYQACNDRICLRPASVPVEMVVRLVAPSRRR